MRRIILVVLIAFAILFGTAYRDVLYMKDGEEIRGNVEEIKKKVIIIETREGVKKFPRENVIRMTMTHPREGDEWETVDDITDQILLDALDRKDYVLTKFPEASHITLYYKSNFELRSDGKIKETIRTIRVILSERGKRVNALKSIGYLSTWQKGDIDFCRTISPMGQIFHVDDAAVEFGEPYGYYSQYNQLKTVRLAPPQLAVGSVLDLQFHRIFETTDLVHPIFESVTFASDEPVYNRIVSVTVPENTLGNGFEYFQNDPTNTGLLYDLPQKEIHNGRITLTWKVDSILPYVNEYNVAPPMEFNPSIWFGYKIDPKELAVALKDSLKSSFDGSPRLDKFVDSLLTGISDPLKKAQRIYEYLSLSVRNVPVRISDSRYFPRKVSEIFTDGNANSLDLCALGVYMLRRVGLDAGILYLSNEHNQVAIDKIPVLDAFTSPAIYMILSDNDTIIGFPHFNYYPLDVIPSYFSKVKAVWVSPNYANIAAMPKADIEQFGNIDTFEIELFENGDGELTITRIYGQSGSSGMRSFREMRKDVIDKDFETRAGDIHPGSKLIKYELIGIGALDSIVKTELQVEAPQLAQSAGGKLMALQLPQLLYSTGWVSLPERKTPMWYGEPAVMHRVWKIKLPDAFKPSFVPENVSSKIDSAWYNLNFTYDKDENMMIVDEQNYIIDKLIIPEEYLDLRQHQFKKANASKTWIILNRKKKR